MPAFLDTQSLLFPRYQRGAANICLQDQASASYLHPLQTSLCSSELHSLNSSSVPLRTHRSFFSTRHSQRFSYDARRLSRTGFSFSISYPCRVSHSRAVSKPFAGFTFSSVHIAKNNASRTTLAHPAFHAEPCLLLSGADSALIHHLHVHTSLRLARRHIPRCTLDLAGHGLSRACVFTATRLLHTSFISWTVPLHAPSSALLI